MRDVAPLASLHVAGDPTTREDGSINGSITARLDPLMDSRRGAQPTQHSPLGISQMLPVISPPVMAAETGAYVVVAPPKTVADSATFEGTIGRLCLQLSSRLAQQKMDLRQEQKP